MANQSARAITVIAGATVSPNLLVTLQTDGKFDPSAAADMSDGVCLEAGVDGTAVPIVVPDSSVIRIEASAAIAVGDLIGAAAAGQIRTAALGDAVLGKALTAAAAAGELVDVLFVRGAVLGL